MSAIIEKKGGESMRCVILSGYFEGNLSAVYRPEPADFLLAADRGLELARKAHLSPDYFIGDCDSLSAPFEGSGRILPTCKDDTDTVFAVKEAILRGFSDFLLLGAVGGRLDHTLGNVSILLMLDAQHKTGMIVDDYSTMQILRDTPVLIDDSAAYFSVLNISGTAGGIDLENVKFPLRDAEITCEYQYGISNEVLPGQIARVRVKNGRALLVIIDTKVPC